LARFKVNKKTRRRLLGGRLGESPAASLEPEHDSDRRLRSLRDGIGVQEGESEVWRLIDRSAIFRSQRNVLDDRKIGAPP